MRPANRSTVPTTAPMSASAEMVRASARSIAVEMIARSTPAPLIAITMALASTELAPASPDGRDCFAMSQSANRIALDVVSALRPDLVTVQLASVDTNAPSLCATVPSTDPVTLQVAVFA